MRKHEKHLSAGQRRPFTRACTINKHFIKAKKLNAKYFYDVAYLCTQDGIFICFITQKFTTICLPSRIENSCKKIPNRSFHSCPFLHTEEIQLLFNTCIKGLKCFSYIFILQENEHFGFNSPSKLNVKAVSVIYRHPFV